MKKLLFFLVCVNVFWFSTNVVSTTSMSLLLPASISTYDATTIGTLTSGVRLISSKPCENRKCHLLGITCLGLPERTALIREFEPEIPIGAIIFTTGGWGTGLYGNISEITNQTVNTVYEAGYETFEVGWQGDEGWGSGVFGAGYADAMCGYAKVVRWLADNLIDQPDLICAQGNSGGSAQIAYGLSIYALEGLLDMVILTGGPPVSRVDVGCFGTEDPGLQVAVWPENILGLDATDKIMGWAGNGDYCKERDSSDEEIIIQAKDTSTSS